MPDFDGQTCPLCGDQYVMPRSRWPLTMNFTALGQRTRCQIELTARSSTAASRGRRVTRSAPASAARPQRRTNGARCRLSQLTIGRASRLTVASRDHGQNLRRSLRSSRSDRRAEPPRSRADVPEVVHRVVHEVPRERLDGERRAVAAEAGPPPLLVGHGVEAARPPSRPPRPARDRRRAGSCAWYASDWPRSRPGPSCRSAGRPRRASARGGRRRRGTRRARGTRTRAPTTGRAGSAARASSRWSSTSHVGRVGPRTGAGLGARRTRWRRSRSRRTAGRGPTSSPCRRERSSVPPRGEHGVGGGERRDERERVGDDGGGVVVRAPPRPRRSASRTDTRRFTASNAKFVIPMFTDTPTPTIVVTPRFRSIGSSWVPVIGPSP